MAVKVRVAVQPRSVSVQGAFALTLLILLAPGAFAANSLTTHPGDPQPGDTVTAFANFTHSGEDDGPYTGALALGGEVVDSETLSADVDGNVTFNLTGEFQWREDAPSFVVQVTVTNDSGGVVMTVSSVFGDMRARLPPRVTEPPAMSVISIVDAGIFEPRVGPAGPLTLYAIIANDGDGASPNLRLGSGLGSWSSHTFSLEPGERQVVFRELPIRNVLRDGAYTTDVVIWSTILVYADGREGSPEEFQPTIPVGKRDVGYMLYAEDVPHEVGLPTFGGLLAVLVAAVGRRLRSSGD